MLCEVNYFVIFRTDFVTIGSIINWDECARARLIYITQLL